MACTSDATSPSSWAICRFLRNFRDGWGGAGGLQHVAERLRPASEVGQHALPVSLLLVGHLPRDAPCPAAAPMGRHRVSRVSPGAADGVPIAGSLAPPLPALAVPQEGGGPPVPGLCGLLEPAADLGGALRVLA